MDTSSSPASDFQASSTPLAGFLSDLDSVTEHLKAVLTLQPSLISQDIPEDLAAAKDNLQDMADRYHSYSDFKARNDKVPFEHVQLSRLTHKHIKDFGIEPQSIPQDIFVTGIGEKLKAERVQGGREIMGLFESFWEKEHLHIVRNLGVIQDVYAARSEARSRTLADNIFLELGYFFTTLLKYSISIFPEFPLAVIGKQPVILLWQGKAIALTGRADYTFLTHLRSDLTDEQLQNLINILREKPDFDSILLPEIRQGVHGYYITINVVELKKKHKSLKDAEAQAIGEAIVVLQKTGQDAVPWSLTNGAAWMFGIVRRGNPIQVIRLSGNIAFDESLKDLNGLKTLMRVLIALNACPDVSGLFSGENQ